MAQYKTGTVSVTNNSTAVVGSGTLWSTEIAAGDWFSINASDEYIYQVASVTDDTNLVLTGQYIGTTGSGKAYFVHRDFTSPDNIPILNEGDVETARVVARMSNTLQGLFNQLTLGGVSQLKDLSDVDPALAPTNGQILQYNSGTGDFEAVTASTYTLDGLTDTNIVSITDGEVIVWDTTTSKYINNTLAEAGIAADSHTHIINDLTDVVITTVAADEVLQYDGANWINQTFTEANIAAADHTHVLNDGTDVVITGTPADNELLAYDSTSGNWINQTNVEAGLALINHAHYLSEMTDVYTSIAPTANQVLTWDAGNNRWDAATAPGSGSIDNLSDVVITTATTNDFLRYDGANWINGPLNRVYTALQIDGVVGITTDATALSGFNTLEVYDHTTTGWSSIRIANGLSGHGTGNGYFIGLQATTGNAEVYNIEAGNLRFGTNNQYVLTLNTDQSTKFEGVALTKQYTTVGLPAAASYEGGIVYDSDTNELKVSDGASWNVIELDGHTHTEADITDLGAYITDITGESIGDLSDVTITAVGIGEVIRHDGTKWINNTLAEAGIATAGHNHSGVYADVSHTHLMADITDSTWISDVTGESIKDLSDVYSAMTPSDGQVLTYDTINGWQAEAVPGGVTDWTALNDTPSSFSGQANKIVRVNAGATALEFTDANNHTHSNYALDTHEHIVNTTSVELNTTVTATETNGVYVNSTLYKTTGNNQNSVIIQGTGNDSAYCVVINGTHNDTTTNGQAVVIGHGATGEDYSASIGKSANAGTYGVALGYSAASTYQGLAIGHDTTVSHQYGVAFGYNTRTLRTGETQFQGGDTTTTNKNNTSILSLKQTTTNATQTEMWFYQAGYEGIDITSSSVMVANIDISAIRTDAGFEAAGYQLKIVAKHDGTSYAQVGSTTKTVLAEDASAAAWDVTADVSGDRIRVLVTGEAAKTINWTASCVLTETLI